MIFELVIVCDCNPEPLCIQLDQSHALYLDKEYKMKEGGCGKLIKNQFPEWAIPFLLNCTPPTDDKLLSMGSGLKMCFAQGLTWAQ